MLDGGWRRDVDDDQLVGVPDSPELLSLRTLTDPELDERVCFYNGRLELLRSELTRRLARKTVRR